MVGFSMYCVRKKNLYNGVSENLPLDRFHTYTVTEVGCQCTFWCIYPSCFKTMVPTANEVTQSS